MPPLCALAPWREMGFLIVAAVLAKMQRSQREAIRHGAETREKAASPSTDVEGPSKDTRLKAISTTLRMKERGEAFPVMS